MEENPLANLKTLYGTGAIKVNDKNEVIRVGGVKYTVKDGIVYDAKKLLEDVKAIVKKAKKKKIMRFYSQELREPVRENWGISVYVLN